jgi:N-hydroxyarylamine O-acetyltransferase
MNHSKYLARIKYQGALTPTLATLTALQQAHLLHVPFENLDIHRGRKIELARSYDKIVRAGRGGFCYELNGLFAELLRALGFTVKMVSARVNNQQGGFGPEYDHLALVVTIDAVDYLVDVGFGEFTLGPLQLHTTAVQADKRGDFIIAPLDAQYQVVQKVEGENLSPEYLFTETARELSEFEPMCHYHQTSPDSHFTQKRLCSLPTAAGRITLTGNTLKIKDGDNVTETLLASEAEFNQALQRYFDMAL